MFALKAETREIDKQSSKNLDSFIPAEVYGHSFANKHVNISRIDFEKLFNQAGESSLINLSIDKEKEITVLIKGVQFNPVSDQVIHIDFYVVKMGEKLTTEIPLEFIGIAKAVKELGGNLVKTIIAIQVSCLPKDLVSKIKVDISVLTDFDKVITIGDLPIPESIEVALDKEIAVCLVQEPRVEKSLAEEAQEAAAEVEAEDEKNKEETKEGDGKSGDKKDKEGVKEGDGKSGDKKE